MKLLTYKPEVTVTKGFPGLITCNIKNKVQTAEADTTYIGPKISPEVWQQVLAFFQWTYDTTHSESQVRLFTNLKERRWAAWAFPQKAKTGMSADELDTDETKKQRAQFNDKDGWIYFGTVHHHCNASAFQSGTDKANEERIDGLHITVGNMGGPRYDLHARFYLSGFCFEPDMSKLWDIGDNLTALLPVDLYDRVARHQMCTKAPTATEFPAQWKENLIEVKEAFPGGYFPKGETSLTQGPYGSGAGVYSHEQWRHDSVPSWLRAKRAVGELILGCKHPYSKKTQEELSDWLQELVTGDSLTGMLLDIMRKFDVTVMQMWSEVPADGDYTPCINAYKVVERKGGEIGNGKGKPDESHRGELDWHGGMMD